MTFKLSARMYYVVVNDLNLNLKAFKFKFAVYALKALEPSHWHHTYYMVVVLSISTWQTFKFPGTPGP